MAYELGVRFGYGAGTGMRSVAQVRDEAVWAAGAGFDSLWVSQASGVDPIVALATISADLPELRELGTSVVPVVGRHPLPLAAQVRTAQSALDGRFTFGVGASHAPVVSGSYGQSFDRPVAQMSEFLQALLPLLDGKPADVTGEHVVARGGLTIEAAATPVLLAALGPRMLELAGTVTAGTSVGSCGPRTIAGHVAPTINAAAERAGRPAPRIVALVHACVTDDPTAARIRQRDVSRIYDTLPSYRRMLDLEGVESGTELLLAGSIDEIVEGFAAYAAAGTTDLRVGIAGNDDERAATRAALAKFLTGSS